MGGRLERPQGADLIGGCGWGRGRGNWAWQCVWWQVGIVYTVMSKSKVMRVLIKPKNKIVAKQQFHFNNNKTDLALVAYMLISWGKKQKGVYSIYVYVYLTIIYITYYHGCVACSYTFHTFSHWFITLVISATLVKLPELLLMHSSAQ